MTERFTYRVLLQRDGKTIDTRDYTIISPDAEGRPRDPLKVGDRNFGGTVKSIGPPTDAAPGHMEAVVELDPD